MTIANTPEGRWNMASLAAVAVICIAFLVHMTVPLPDVTAVNKKSRAEQKKLAQELKRLEGEITEARSYVQSKLWKSGPDNLGAEAMSVVDRFAKKDGVSVQAFRPQRTVKTGEVVRYPYSVTVQGTFPKVLQLVRDLQGPGTLLAVTSVQLSSADGTSDSVLATIGIAAFLESVEVKTNGK